MMDESDFPPIKKRSPDLPPDFTVKRPIYHGTNTSFDKFDFGRGGGLVHFAEKPEHAWTYAHDLGSGSRNAKRWSDIRVEDLESGQSFLYDDTKKLWISADGKESIPFENFREMMDEGDRYFEAYPKDARVIKAKVDMSKVLDTYPDKSQPYYRQANKQGLEAFLDIVRPEKVENTVNPQFSNVSQRYVERIRKSAHDEMKGTPGAPGFGNTFWGTTKHVAGAETREAVRGVTDQLKSAGYDAIRFADDSHPTIGMMNPPETFVDIVKRKSAKGLKYLPKLGLGLSAAGALTMPDMAQAAVDTIIPGGVESMGVSDEQRELDRRYRERIRQKQDALNNL